MTPMANPAPRGGSRVLPALLVVVGAVATALVAWHVPDRHPPDAAGQAGTALPVTSAAPSQAAAVALAPIARRGARHRESPVCGWDGTARGHGGGSAGARPLPADVRTETLQALDARMLASRDPAIQAAALLIGARTRPQERRERIERLARLATGTVDARVYAVAEEGCKDLLDDGSSACRALESTQWAQLDANNAVPWLALAESSRARGDAAAEDEAMYHASHALRSDTRPAILPSLVEQALEGEPPHSLLRTLGLATSWQVQDGWSMTSTTQAMHYCEADDRVLTDPERAANCDLLARLLAEGRGGPIDMATAGSIGSRLRWPVDRLNALTAQGKVVGTTFQKQKLQDLSCKGVANAEASLHATMAGDPAGAGAAGRDAVHRPRESRLEENKS